MGLQLCDDNFKQTGMLIFFLIERILPWTGVGRASGGLGRPSRPGAKACESRAAVCERRVRGATGSAEQRWVSEREAGRQAGSARERVIKRRRDAPSAVDPANLRSDGGW